MNLQINVSLRTAGGGEAIASSARKSVTQLAKFRYNSSAGRIAQLVRASLLHREGQGFESLCAHQFDRRKAVFQYLPIQPHF